MQHYFDILRFLANLLAPLLGAAYEHPLAAEAASLVWDLLRFVAVVVLTYLLHEHVLKRGFPPPSPTEDARRERLAESGRAIARAEREIGRLEGERHAARGELVRERSRTARSDAERRDTLSPWRRRMLRNRSGPS